MTPVICDRDRILVAPVGATALRIGDIAQYRLPSGVRVHRLIGRRTTPAGEALLVFAGDNSDDPPDVVEGTTVEGRVVAVQSGGRLRRLDSWTARSLGFVKLVKHRLKHLESWRAQ